MMKKVAMILSSGSIEGAYKALNVATAASTMDVAVSVFCTFGGLKLLQTHLNYELTEELAPFRKGLEALPSIAELRDMAVEMGVKFIACQMTMDLMGISADQLIGGIVTAGAASFLEEALEADSTVTF